MHAHVLHAAEQRRAYLKRLTGRRPARRKTVPRAIQPDGVRLAYYRALVAEVLAFAKQLVDESLLPELETIVREVAESHADGRMDARGSKRVNELMDRASERFYRMFTPAKLEAFAEKFGRRTSAFQRAELGRQLRAVLGVDPQTAEPWLEGAIREFVGENVALIKSIPQSYFDQVEARVIAGARAGKRHEVIAKEVAERFEVSKSRAKLIARDQVGKFNGKLAETRQKKLGIDAYIWRTVNDNRVRDEHVDREGKRYVWSKPPYDGHPGEPINCRCYAEPDLAALLGEI